MDIKLLKTKDDYLATLQEIESLMRAEPGTPEGKQLDALVTLVEDYKRRHSPCFRVGGRSAPGAQAPE